MGLADYSVGSLGNSVALPNDVFLDQSSTLPESVGIRVKHARSFGNL